MRHLVPALVISSTMMFSSLATATINVKEDYSNVPESGAPTLPGAKKSFADPDFGTTIIQVTDASTDPNPKVNGVSQSTTYCLNRYSFWPAFNRDSTYLYVACNDDNNGLIGRIYTFDPAHPITSGNTSSLAFWDFLAPDGNGNNNNYPVIGWQSPSWSMVDPKILWGMHTECTGTDPNVTCTKRKLYKMDVSQKGTSRFLSISGYGGTDSQGNPYIADFENLFTYSGQDQHDWYISNLSVSEDDKIFAFVTESRHTNDSALDVGIYNAAVNKMATWNRGTHTVHDVLVSKDGSKIMAIPKDTDSNPYQRFILTVDWSAQNPTATLSQTLSSDIPGGNELDSIGGHEDLGRSLFANSDGWSSGDGSQIRDIASMTNHRHTLNYHDFNGLIADHISMRNASEQFYIDSTYTGVSSGDTWNLSNCASTSTCLPFGREIVLVNTNGSGFVRLAHTYSQTEDDDGDGLVDTGYNAAGANSYDSQPHAVVDNMGRYVVYGSNYNRSRIDVFILQIPRFPTRTTVGNQSNQSTYSFYHLDRTGRLYGYSGSSWTQLSTPSGVTLNGGLSDKGLFVVGSDGHVYSYTNGTSTDYSTPPCGYAVGAPAVDYVGTNPTKVAVRCWDGEVAILTVNSGVGSWQNLGRPALPPANTTNNTQFGLSSSNAGLIAVTDPSITCATTYCSVALIESDGSIWDAWYDTSASAVKWRIHLNPTGTGYSGRPVYMRDGPLNVGILDAVGNLWRYAPVSTTIATAWPSANNFLTPSGISCTLTGDVEGIGSLNSGEYYGYMRCSANSFSGWSSGGDSLQVVFLSADTGWHWSTTALQSFKFYQPVAWWTQTTIPGPKQGAAAFEGTDGTQYQYATNGSSYSTTSLGTAGGP